MRDIKIMSFNIRNPCDRGTESWESRLPRITALIEEHVPDLMGFQEVMHGQYKNLTERLHGYGHAGAGRDDGFNAGERAAVFYRESRFERLETGNFWLSKTPELPSMGWDAVCIRICTYVKLHDKLTGRELYHFNTHLDHVGKKAMLNGARLVRARLLEKNAPAFVTGDFNVTETSEPYAAMTENRLSDAKYTAGESMGGGTFHGYNPGADIDSQSPIDYLFHTDDFDVISYKVLVNGGRGEYSSDHYPILVRLKLKEQ